MIRNRLVAALLALAALIGCTDVELPADAPRRGPDPLADWAAVLERFVDERGRVDYAGLAAEPERLLRYLDYVYEVGPHPRPDLFPARADRLAYYINAYNALAMYNVLDSGVPESLGGWRLVPFFVLRRFPVGGGAPISLYDLENGVIRSYGEERVHFALNCMAAGCPRLPREPFRAEALDAQLEREARRFFAEPRNLRVDHDARTVHVSELLDFYSEDFLDAAPSLIAYINRYRDGEPIPEDYAVEFLDYDWTVNRQPEPPAVAAGAAQEG